MLSLRSHGEVLYVDAVSVEPAAGGWVISWSETDVNSMIERRYVVTTEQVIASGPHVRMTADALDALARAVDRDPASLPWCTERRLLERVVADDLDGVRSLLTAKAPTTVKVNDVPEPILTIALGVAAWKVAAELILRGEPLAPPPNTSWDAASYTTAALDDSEGARVVLQHLLARRALVPKGGELRLARAPWVVHTLIDAGADPDGLEPSSPTLGLFLKDATPLAVAVIHSDRDRTRTDIATALLERGATLEARDVHGRTALIAAAAWGFEWPVRWLLERGAKVRCAADRRRRTPHSIALQTPDDPTSRLLLEAFERER